MNDLFPNHINTNSSKLHSLHLNTDIKQISKIYTHHTYPAAARLPRIVKISLENKFSFSTRLIRLEFDHSTVNYYSEIDTIILYGKNSSTTSILNEDTKEILPSTTVSHTFMNSFNKN
jgi:hypothetical protein